MLQYIYNNSFKKYKENEGKEFPIDIDSFIEYLIEKEDDEKAILILPTKKYVQEVRNKFFIRKYERFKNTEKACTVSELKFYTLEEFSKKVLDKILDRKENINYIDRAMSILFMQKAINKINKEQGFEYYKKDDNSNYISIQMLDKISSIILGLKEDGIRACDIENNDNYDSDDIITYEEKRFNDIFKIYKDIKKIDFSLIY